MTTENKRLNYFGAKAIKAEPMSLGDYNKLRGWTIPENENPAKEGYLVEYPNGYISWSPKEVFEEAYAWVPENETNAHAAIKIAMREVEKLGIGKNFSNAAAFLNLALIQVNQKEPAPQISQEEPNIPPHEQRMIDEYQQLTDKIVKGRAFTETELFKSLPEQAQQLLKIQLELMDAYAIYLSHRIPSHGPWPSYGMIDPVFGVKEERNGSFLSIPIYHVKDEGISFTGSFFPIPFCKGNAKDPSALRQPGLITESILEAARQYLVSVNVGEVACRETSSAITKIDEAIMWLNKRASDRKRRQVQGTYDK